MHSQLFYAIILIVNYFNFTFAAMTMKQIEQSLAMFRKSCTEKTGVEPSLIDGLHRGEWPEDIPNLKGMPNSLYQIVIFFFEFGYFQCFTLCVAVTSGSLTKKNEISEAKVKKQIETQLPANLRPLALGALEACKDVQKNYKDPCERIFYATKCLYDYSPKDFLYP